MKVECILQRPWGGRLRIAQHARYVSWIISSAHLKLYFHDQQGIMCNVPFVVWQSVQEEKPREYLPPPPPLHLGALVSLSSCHPGEVKFTSYIRLRKRPFRCYEGNRGPRMPYAGGIRSNSSNKRLWFILKMKVKLSP
jgi:hypothetical protein